MHDDDGRVGRVLDRREALALLGLSGAALAAGRTPWLEAGSAAGALRLPSCIVRPAQAEGPYFVDGVLNRSDIRADPATGQVPEGVPLEVAIAVSRLGPGGCAPLPGVHVDLWQCDALGVYSDVRDARFDTVGRRFLRGYQVTDGDGSVGFTTIYPGWYQGRAVHLHFKIRTDAGASRGREFTSQLYFDEAVTDRAFAAEPYAAYRERRTRNADDRIFRTGGGSALMLEVVESGAGYRATFDVGLEWS